MWQLGNVVVFYRCFNDSKSCNICKKLTVGQRTRRHLHISLCVCKIASWATCEMFFFQRSCACLLAFFLEAEGLVIYFYD